jgi:hypothetical protein
MPPELATTILLIGGDGALGHLMARYAERLGLSLALAESLGDVPLSTVNPSAIWFSSLEALVTAGSRDGIDRTDVPLLVCSATGDEERARELGVDYFAVHPLTYQDFVAALDTLGISRLPANAEPPR